MGRTRTVSVLAALALAATLLAACDGGSDDAAGPSATISASPTSTEATATLEPIPGESSSTPAFAADDEVLTVAVHEAATLDPMRIEDPAAVLIARQLFEGLTRWAPETNTVEPAAAESWEVTKKGTLFTFTLRDDMTFHDGTPVTARDFKFAFDRIADKSSASNIAYTLERVEGFEEVNQLGEADSLTGVKAVDDVTLEITLVEPYYEFPVVLTHPGLVPVPADAINDVDTFLSQPIGNGPFESTAEWSPGDTLELRAFEGFWDAPDVDGLRFVPYEDAAASWVPFVTGELDIAEIPADRIDVAIERYGEAGVLPLLAGYYYGFNLTSKNLEDENLRRGISRAIDRDAIARSIYRGTLAEPRGIVPEGMPGFEKDVCRQLCDFSRSAARKLVQEVDGKDRRVTIEYTEGQPHRRVAEAVRDDLEAVGIEVKVEAFKFPKYLKMLRAGKQEMYRFGWLAEFPSPSVFLSSLFLSTSPDNHAEFSAPQVDDLLRRAAAEEDEEKRTRKYLKAEKLIIRRLPVAPLGNFVTHWAAGPRVEEIAWDTMGGFDAVAITLAEDQ